MSTFEIVSMPTWLARICMCRPRKRTCRSPPRIAGTNKKNIKEKKRIYARTRQAYDKKD